MRQDRSSARPVAPGQSPGASQAPALGLAALFTATGITHLVVPSFYDAIVPPWLPGSPGMWTLVSGLAELACALALCVPATRRAGATAAALLLVAVFPANIQMAVDWRHRGLAEQLVAYGRLPLQVPLVAWALWARRWAGR
ncbi:MAG TPA: hypothetical protein VFW71_10100 [Actinomycetota bacterium]|nr:hypothetical protein [Actinomycetota bacterium]